MIELDVTYIGGIFMPRRFIHLAFFLFILTALSGLWLRLVPFVDSTGLPYDHILHGHSHIAILGWAFFGVYIILLKLLWPSLQEKKHATLLGLVIFSVSLVMFLAFLYEGYAMYSIIMSTLHIFVEYWAIVFIFKQLRKQKDIPKISQFMIKGALLSLFLSSIGPFALGYLGATGLKDSPFFDMSIYFFLHFQYNGFLTLFLLGLFFIILHRSKIPFSKEISRTGFWLYLISLFPWYLSSIMWTGLGSFAKLLATLGTIGQFIGMVLIFIAISSAFKEMRKKFAPIISFGVVFSLIFLIAKSSMELGLISNELSALVFDTRSVIIGYLHLTLLGFISFFIFVQFQMVNLLQVAHQRSMYGMVIFLAGFLLNELILFLQGLSSWTGTFTVPYSFELLVLASILLSLAILIYWSSLTRKASG